MTKTITNATNLQYLNKEVMKMDKMPRINPHAPAIKQDYQLRKQLRWLKQNGFKNVYDAQRAGY